MLETGDSFVLDRDKEPATLAGRAAPSRAVRGDRAGDRLLIDDGKVRLKVRKPGPDRIVTEVEVGGRVSDNKGVNVPDVVVPIPALTDKDRADLQFALEQNADWIALSFVQRPEDVAEARALIGDKAALMAKIEKPAAIDRLDDIIALADGVMVARGDLGVELPPEDVPPLQNKIVAAARQFGKPVVVATQMLESMITSPTPTRAEVSDVATAIYDGADAVMLSAESATGEYPCEAVAMMDRIARASKRPDLSGANPFHRDQARADHRRRDRRARRHIANTISARRWSATQAPDRPRGGSPASGRGAAAGDEPFAGHGAGGSGLLWGVSRGPHPRRRQLRGNGRQGEADGASPQDRRGRRPAGDHGRSAVRPAGSTNVIHVVGWSATSSSARGTKR
jgi:pyruvate kinase